MSGSLRNILKKKHQTNAKFIKDDVNSNVLECEDLMQEDLN